MNVKLSDEDKTLFHNSPVEESLVTQKNLFTRLWNLNKFSGVAIVRTEYMSQFLNPAAVAPHEQPEQLLLEASQLAAKEVQAPQPEQLLLEVARLAEKEE